ncbi:MAG: 4-hydroxy-3-methylbut-2-enyl diphosphate reductase [Ignavibacteriaceae bacterium]|nr:4-hydroxy-3-methylbut-2-enyl diphosphate reductase [Ignavibacteriaceae bacterium]
MTVTIDKNAGFCWGVVRTIEIAERELENKGIVYSLGDVIHNTLEVERLNKLGLTTINHDDLTGLPKGSKVLIRAHGEPPQTYKTAMELGIDLVDATCPIVTKVQERVRKFVDKDFQVVIYGKQNHAEVIGINGVTGNTAIVVLTKEEALERVDFSKPTVLFTQTTMDKNEFKVIAEALREKLETLIIGSMEETAVEYHAKDTICGQVSGREKKLQEFARTHDVIIFTAGRKSSNGKVLYHIAHDVNEKTFFAETKDEINFSWFEGANSVGITGATSTPQWVMEEIKKLIEEKFEFQKN